MSQEHSTFQLSDESRKLKPTVYIGKNSLRTDVTPLPGIFPSKKGNLPDLTLQMAFLNEFFYKQKNVHFIRISVSTQTPEELYKRYTKLLRHANNGRWRKEPVSGFRLCNVQQRIQGWRFTSNLACTGSRYAAVLFADITRLLCPHHYLYVTFKSPRKTLYNREYRRYYGEFYERSHLLQSQARINMLEPYFWRLEGNDTAYLVQILFDIFGPRIQTIYTDPLNGVEITQSPNIDPEDYFSTDRHLLDCRIRFFQPFGGFYNLLNQKPAQQ